MSIIEEIFKKHQNDTHVMISGDWHGNTAWALKEIKRIKRKNANLILHLGDFGFWMRADDTEKEYLDELEKLLEKLDVDIFVTLGNHEDWFWFTGQWSSKENQDENGSPKPIAVRPHIIALPKVYKFFLNGKSFLSVGGAVSVDRKYRKLDVSWFKEEEITEIDTLKAIELGPVDFMLTHESPQTHHSTYAVKEILVYGGDWIPEYEKAISSLSREKISRIFQAVKPEILFHGHMHVFDHRMVQLPDSNRESYVISLNCDGMDNNSLILEFVNKVEIDLM